MLERRRTPGTSGRTMQEFRGKVAVVTGAASGIGLASARCLAREGMAVALLDIRSDELRVATEEVASLGGRAIGIVTDVADLPSVEAAKSEVLATFGKVHLLMNNAAVFIRGHAIASVGDEVWDWLLGVNLYGPLHCIRSLLPQMQAQGEGGHIVNMASISGFVVGDRQNGLYCAGKFALVALSEALAHDLAGSGIEVSVVMPAAVASKFYENSAQLRGALGGPNRFPTAPPDTVAGMSPDEVAARVLEGVRRNSFYIPTHSSTRALLEQRHRTIMAAYDAAAQWRS
jgi:NAD(P)-dependent dehydrogenase (short-subunit alcohol dehydrogenase family)